MRSISRVVAVLKIFSPEEPILSLQKIADKLGMAKSTTFRLVHSLEAEGLLSRAEMGHYCLSQHFVRFGAIASHSLSVAQILRPILLDLAISTGENVSLSTLKNYKRLCLATENSNHPIIEMHRPNEYADIGLGGASMVLLAGIDKNELKDFLPDILNKIECDEVELTSILDTVRRQGYAVSHGGIADGITGISAPILDGQGNSRFCMTIVLPTKRSRNKVELLIKAARESSMKASKVLFGENLKK